MVVVSSSSNSSLSVSLFSEEPFGLEELSTGTGVGVGSGSRAESGFGLWFAAEELVEESKNDSSSARMSSESGLSGRGAGASCEEMDGLSGSSGLSVDERLVGGEEFDFTGDEIEKSVEEFALSC